MLRTRLPSLIGLDVGIRDLAGTCPAEESVVSLLAEA
jgi:hypothetical protein